MSYNLEFPIDLLEYLPTNTLIKIKGGSKPRSFLEIWMVSVGGRLFARTWQKSKRSWYTAFLEEGVGQIQYGDKVINVLGKKVDKDEDIIKLIDQAYLDKYTQKGSVEYAKGITQKEYQDYTMEFEFHSLSD